MSYSVAAIVSTLVIATAKSAQGAHHGHDNRCVSSIFAMRRILAPREGSRRVKFPFRNRQQAQIV